MRTTIASVVLAVAFLTGCAVEPSDCDSAASSTVEVSEQIAERLTDCTDGIPVYIDSATGNIYGDQDRSGHIDLWECEDK